MCVWGGGQHPSLDPGEESRFKSINVQIALGEVHMALPSEIQPIILAVDPTRAKSLVWFDPSHAQKHNPRMR